MDITHSKTDYRVQTTPTTLNGQFTGETENTSYTRHQGRNPRLNLNYMRDYLQESPLNQRRFKRFDQNLSQVNTPWSESFNKKITSTLTPTSQRRYFGKTEPMQIPLLTRRPEHLMHPGAIPRNSGPRTSGQPSSSPSHPGGSTKAIRDMAPNCPPLFHYRFYDQMSKTPPDFTKLQLSPGQVKDYIKGLTQTRDDTNGRYGKFITYGLESYHTFKLYSLENNTFRYIKIEDIKIPRDKTKEIKEEHIYIPEHALEDFDNPLQAVYLEVMQPMQYDRGYKGNLLLFRAAREDWKAKATVHTSRLTQKRRRIHSNPMDDSHKTSHSIPKETTRVSRSKEMHPTGKSEPAQITTLKKCTAAVGAITTLYRNRPRH